MCDYLFQEQITENQEKIVRSVAFDNYKEIVICCPTRYGKSFCVSMGILIYILTHVNKRILLIAPINDQSKIIRDYIGQFLPRSQELTEIVEVEQLRRVDKLKREVSRKRVTFTNGCELMMLSAEGDAQRLMGHGGDLIILDEDCLISGDTYKRYISRMTMDNPDTRIVEIGNPWNRLNQMYEHWIDPKYHTIHIDYKIGIKEGRYTSADIEEKRAELTPYEFTVLWEAVFPEESESSLFKYEWIEKAINSKFEFKPGYIKNVAGLDVAEGGADFSVLTKARTKSNHYIVDEIHVWHKADTMATVGKVRSLIDESYIVNIDAIGVGKGVYDRLKEDDYQVSDIKVGRSPTREKDRMLNQKSQFYWRLRTLFEQGQIRLNVDNQKLISELMSLEYEFTSVGKIKIIDPVKSPDYADSLMLCCLELERKGSFAVVGVSGR